MTTSNKNFKVKNGLEVLGASATVNGNEVLTIASSIAALADVDLTGAVAGNSLVFDSSLNLIPGEGSGGGIAKYYVSDTKPTDPQEGIVWYNSATGETFIYIVDEDSEQFVEVGTFGPAGATGPQGPAGADGADSTVPGPQGEQGESGIVAQAIPPIDTDVLWYDTSAPGYGIPLGGTAGQVLSKIDSEAFNTQWTTPYSQSNANFDLANLQSAILDDAPTSLNTLGKISNAINDDPNFHTTITSELDNKTNIGHVHAISSITNLQAELDDKAEIVHTHNDLYYTKGYVDDVLSDKSDVLHNHDDRYYTEAETNSLVSTSIETAITNLVDMAPSALDTLNELAASINDDANFAGTVTTALAGKSDIGHTHDDRYYTEGQVDTLLTYKSDNTHLHDDRYYTETEVDLAISEALAALVPSGTIIQSARSTAPAGYLTCDGSEISRTTYSSLFSAIGTAYGSGNGSTTFNVPNLKGRVPVGYDPSQTEFDALGETGGQKAVTLTASQIPSHTHSGTTGNQSQNHTHSFSGTTSTNGNHQHTVYAYKDKDDLNFTGNSNRLQGSDAVTPYDQLTSANGDHSHTYSGTTAGVSQDHTHSFTTDGGTGGGQAHTNLQPYVVLNYMIKI